jgi:type VII secretion protein EccE
VSISTRCPTYSITSRYRSDDEAVLESDGKPMTTTAQDRVATAPDGGTPRGRRRRGHDVPPPFGHVRPPQRHRDGLSLLGIPVATVVAVELVAICVLLVAERKLVVAVVAVAIGTLIVVAALFRRRNLRIGTWAALRFAYLLRTRETLVAASSYAGGSRRTRADDPSDELGEPDGAVDLVPELEAFFPGMTVWEARTHDGDRMGIVQWFGTSTAVLQIAAPGGIVRVRNTSADLPLSAIVGAVDGQDLGIDSIQVLTQTIVGEQDPTLTPLLAAATAELGSARSRVRNRSTFVAVRLDPSTSFGAIAARGGGNVGIGRVLSAALSRIRAACGEQGLDSEVLDSTQAARAIADSFYHLATPYDPVIRWVESVKHIASTRMAHRSFVVTDLHRPTLAEIPAGNVFAYALGVQTRPLPSGGWSTRTVIRLTCRSTNALNAAARELRSTARRAGVTLQPLDAVQHLGLRATVPAGGI